MSSRFPELTARRPLGTLKVIVERGNYELCMKLGQRMRFVHLNLSVHSLLLSATWNVFQAST